MSDEKSEAQAQLAKICEAADVRPGHLYRHHKGGEYIVFAVTLDEATLLPLVHYYSMDRKTRWSRSLDDFTDEVGRHPSKYRFEWVRGVTTEELMKAFDVTLIVWTIQPTVVQA